MRVWRGGYGCEEVGVGVGRCGIVGVGRWMWVGKVCVGRCVWV